MAPNLKGRPRKKKVQRRDSCSTVKECSGHSDGRAVAKVKNEAKSALLKPKSSSSTSKKAAEDGPTVASGDDGRAAEQTFLVGLYKYMKDRKTPIERIPYLGFKQINLWTLFQAAHKLGGYETITARRQWKHVYDELGGNPGSTSAATCTRRHYERLLLPYERFMKGEEDKPLPPVKPRKQDQNSPEAEMKTELSEDKQMKPIFKKNKKDKSSTQEPQKDIENSVKQEEGLNTEKEEHTLPDTPVALKELTALQQERLTFPPGSSQLIATDVLEANRNRNITRDEDTDGNQNLISNDLIALKAEQESEVTGEHSERNRDTPPSPMHEHFLQSCTSPADKETKFSPVNMYHDSQSHVSKRNCADDYEPQMPDYVANCTVKMDPLGTGVFKSTIDSNILKTALRQNTNVYVVQSLDVLKQKELLATRNENPTVGCTPLLFSRGNPGIMSPLAKKKLLSQVSGASLSSSYPYGSPPALVSKKRSNGCDEAPASGLHGTQGCSTDSVAINRPSVIQHVQSFKAKFDEDRLPASDCTKQGSSSKADTQCCDFTKIYQNSQVDSFVLKSETAKNARQHYHVASLLSGFYSSPHLHSLYKQTEHHLHSGQSTKLFSKDIFSESESSSSLAKQQKHQEKRHLIYNPPFQHQEKHSVEESSAYDQPTDLSMPKPLNKQIAAAPELSLADADIQQEKKPLYKYKSENNQTLSSEGNPKACRVSPMIMSPAKKLSERNPRSSPSHNLKLDGLRRVEGTAHLMASSKMVNIGTARPLKRSVEEQSNNTSEKKIRIVSPLHLSKETVGQETFSHQGGERSKSVHDSHSGTRLDSHRYPLSSPISSGLYAGSLCSGLNYHIPSSHSIPIHHLKIQNLYSQVMPPTTLESFMTQRHLLASSANSQQLYRHLAASTPAGSPYLDLLYNNIYPLASISPQNAFPPSQLSSAHPSTKL